MKADFTRWNLPQPTLMEDKIACSWILFGLQRNLQLLLQTTTSINAIHCNLNQHKRLVILWQWFNGNAFFWVHKAVAVCLQKVRIMPPDSPFTSSWKWQRRTTDCGPQYTFESLYFVFIFVFCICICMWSPSSHFLPSWKCQKRAPEWSNSHGRPLYGNFTNASSTWHSLYKAVKSVIEWKHQTLPSVLWHRQKNHWLIELVTAFLHIEREILVWGEAYPCRLKAPLPCGNFES